MSATPEPVRTQLTGTVGGRDLTAVAVVSLETRGLLLATDRGRVLLPVGAVAGVAREAEHAVLWLEQGDVLRLGRAAGLDAVLAAFEARARALPELTRSLRALGTRRAASVPEHDRFFAPLLAGCRAAAEQPSPERALRAFEATALAAAITAELSGIAAERYPGEPPEQRALEAELSEAAEPLLARIESLGARQRELAGATAAESFRRWRRWTGALRRTFEAADDCWTSVAAILEPGRRGTRGKARGRRAASRSKRGGT